MAENLNYQTKDSYCYGNDPANCEKYGRLYTWVAANYVCPEGWHLPTSEEFRTLISNVGGVDVAGKMLKSMIGWGENDNGVDVFGFSVLPAGGRYYSGNFSTAGKYAYFWSATEGNEYNAYYWYLLYIDEGAGLYIYSKDIAHSVRCFRD